METDLRKRLEAFDGVHTATLEAIFATVPSDPPVLSELCNLALSDERNMQSASTWLLKRFTEGGVRLSETQSEALLGLLMRESHWEAKLHVLQMMAALTLSAAAVPALWSTLIDMTSQANNLVRAWSYNGLAVLADRHWAYRAEAVELLERGAEDEASSIRARIRRLRKEVTWLRG